ncbi:MAG: hypothetical protein PWR01_3078 [Clostridiales bacterium]|nr:hypothetical protein [Clostridiales bacterium]MDN5282005.1 hypothetical protein [Candidatus Ozemobacter sp.]
MINKRNSRSGTIAYLIMALLLTLFTISTAVLLNSMHKAGVAPTAALLKADYQIESAIVMQMQKIKNEGSENFRKINFSKEISPGFFLFLAAEQLSPKAWEFNVKVDGPGFSRNIKARASLQNPDRIIHLRQ